MNNTRKLLLVLLTICIIGCDSDNDDVPVVPETFLEKNGGTKWEAVADDEGYISNYIAFRHDINKPIQSWWLYNEECYNQDDWDDVLFTEILTNTENSFSISISITEINKATLKFTISSDRLKLVSSGTNRDGDDFNRTIYLNKTSENLNSLTLCE